MKTVLALSAALLSLVATSAEAQRRAQEPAPLTTQSGSRQFNLSKEARPAIAALQTAVTARDAAAYAAALPAAQAAAKNADERYVVATLQLQYAQGGTDKAATLAAIDGVLATGGVLPADVPRYQRAIAELSFETGNFARSAQAFEELARLTPGDSDVLANLSIVRSRQGRDADALAALDRAIAARQAAGQPISEDWRKRTLALATKLKNNPVALRANYDLVAANPTPANWTDALQNHQYLVPLDESAELDRLRLMRAAGALKGERAYRYFAEILLARGLSGEAKAVLDEGVAANQVSRSKPEYAALIRQATTRAAGGRATLASAERGATTARQLQGLGDAYLGYGEYAKAADFFRRALAAGGGDAALLNTRLGIALAYTGDKPGAQAAFGTVTGPRADLVRYWRLWSDRRA